MTEREFQAQVVKLARLLGWAVFHPFDSRRSVSGYPDLTMVHAKRRHVLWAELKTDAGRLKPKQAEWGRVLSAAGEDWRVWRPRDWPEIERTLKGETPC